jgi:carboxyl-terminal processing protease
MNKRAFLALSFSILATTALIGGFVGKKVQATSTAPVVEQTRSIDVENSFTEAVNLVQGQYAGKLENDGITKAAILGMLRTLDPHSNYFDSKEFQELQSEQRSQFYGIGVTINRRNNRIHILSTIKDTPADKAGLRYGDAILTVDGKDARDWTTQQVLEKVRGPKDEAVEITVARAGSEKPLPFRIVRDAVPLPSIRNAFMLRPNVGYIGLVGGFNHTTEGELMLSLMELRNRGMTSLVLDLRNNPGGLLTQAVKVASMFLQRRQTIVSIRGRNDHGETRTYDASNTIPENLPLVILINRNTASASEIVAGAVQDHDRGLVIGEDSFGKGLVQTVFRLPFGSGLTLTTAKYYTPSGRSIQRDYSSLSFYEYYMQRSRKSGNPPTPTGKVHRTDTGRNVYSGGGIRPDIEVKPTEPSVLRNRIVEATFEFARQLTAGQIAGFAQFKVVKTVYKDKLGEDEYQINDKLLAVFRNFVINNEPGNERFRLTEPQFNEQTEYIRQRIREEVVTAAYGSEAGNQVLLQADEQVLRAVKELPHARELADNARRTLKNQ